MLCPECGSEIPENAEFCPQCNNKPEKPAKKKKLPIIIIASAAALILVVVGILVIPKLVEDDNGGVFSNNSLGNGGSSNNTNGTAAQNGNEADPNAEKIAAIINEAEGLAGEKDYEGALDKVNAGLVTYPESEDLKKKAEEYTAALQAQVKAETLDEAKRLAESGDYAAAMAVIENALETQPEDADYQNAYDTYKQSLKAEALETADGFAQQKDYLSAWNTIAQAMDTIGEDAELAAKAEEYEGAYVADICTQVDALVAENNISAAQELLRDAQKHFSDNDMLKTYADELEKYKNVLLNTLDPINGGFTWNDGTPADPFDTDYSGVQNYAILHKQYHNNDSQTYSAEYKVDAQYDLLTFTVSPYSDFGQDYRSYVQIYADGTLRYTLPKLAQKTQPQTISVEVSGATYIKITVTVGGKYGCVMLSDVMLSCVPNYVSSQVDGYTPLSALSTFNGSVSWFNGYPANTRGDDYTKVKNYTILHRQYHSNSSQKYSAEYYVNKQYESLSFDIAPATDFNAAYTSYVKVYLDDVLVYTSPAITQKTELFSTGNIDVSNASYLKIVVEIGGKYGCVILSDVFLKNK